MRRQEIIFELKKYFKIYELVGKYTYRIHKDRAWKFFSTESLEMLLIIRKNIDRPMTINTWFWGGKFSQRGLRSNLSTIFKRMFSLGKLYLSAHVLGEGFDFDVEGMTAPEVRQWVKENAFLFPMKVRLERLKKGKQINWVHADVMHEEKNPKIYEFDV